MIGAFDPTGVWDIMTRPSPVSIYDDDFFAWTKEQAAALRQIPRHAIGDIVDIEHVAEEIEDLGKRDLRDVTSGLARLFEHLIKIDNAPASRDVPHWRGEARTFQAGANDAFSPSMRRLIEISPIWEKAAKRAQAALKDVNLTVSSLSNCPFTLDELLTDDFDVDLALAKLAGVKAEP